ncbi:addiction module protein [Persicirhabdus sediminis]|uniref:Addiction module protein n=1 Tax=Persicirhabdus sediminis TaxID=454144 RepID=A0A8J7MG55_9BACT|nr:addiction module protein [Persicirhabdus sediminis]MBK1792422.1 addiction module protein [Persicirhabdus sediminis]
MNTAADIFDHAMNLSTEDKTLLVEKLLLSLQRELPLSDEWLVEIDRRVQKRRSGESQPISQTQVHREIEALLE